MTRPLDRKVDGKAGLQTASAQGGRGESKKSCPSRVVVFHQGLVDSLLHFLQGDPLGERSDRSSTHSRFVSSGAVFSSRRGLRLPTSRTWSSIERVNYLEVGGLFCFWTDGDYRAAVAKEGLVRIGLVRIEGLMPKKLNEGLLFSVG